MLLQTSTLSAKCIFVIFRKSSAGNTEEGTEIWPIFIRLRSVPCSSLMLCLGSVTY